jgi:hypothetical protein
MKLTDEEQCMLSLMEIAGFPLEIENGLYVLDDLKLGMPRRMGSSGPTKHATDNFEHIVSVFNFWKKRKNGED